MQTLWNTFIYEPLYNLLQIIINFLPNADVGFAVIILTLLIKLILFPLTQRSIDSQMAMRSLEPQIAEIKKTITDKTEQNKKVFELYRENKINPFSGCLLLLIQLPVIIALYLVFLRGFDQPGVDLYSFVSKPEQMNAMFLGLIDLGSKSIVLALLAGLSQFVQARLARGRQSKPTGDGMQAQIAKTMQIQMVYALPVFVAFIAYRVSAAVALYWLTSNLVTIAQEIYTKRKMNRKNNGV